MCLLTSSRTSSNEGKEEVNRVGFFYAQNFSWELNAPLHPMGSRILLSHETRPFSSKGSQDTWRLREASSQITC